MLDFSLFFRASHNIIWKKEFCHKFFFLNGFPQTPTPLTTKICYIWQKFFVDAPLLTHNAGARKVYYFFKLCFLKTSVELLSLISFIMGKSTPEKASAK